MLFRSLPKHRILGNQETLHVFRAFASFGMSDLGNVPTRYEEQKEITRIRSTGQQNMLLSIARHEVHHAAIRCPVRFVSLVNPPNRVRSVEGEAHAVANALPVDAPRAIVRL